MKKGEVIKTEWIVCPECSIKQEANVRYDFPWLVRIHECEQCEYVIMESEWELDKD